jgi:cysteine protease ATG4
MIIFLITSRRTLHPTSPTFLSVFGWFEHAFHSSATDLSLPNLINTIPPPSSSPKGKSSARLTAAKHANGPLDKAMRCLKRDSTPSECTDPIWLLRVQHSGYEPPPQRSVTDPLSQWFRHSRQAFSSRTSTSSIVTAAVTLGGNDALSSSQTSSKNPGAYRPPEFYAGLTSR